MGPPAKCDRLIIRQGYPRFANIQGTVLGWFMTVTGR
jgi:hypothetical protein